MDHHNYLCEFFEKTMHYGEKDELFEQRIARLVTATMSTSDSDLAKKLGIRHQNVSAVRKSQQIPPSWYLRVADKFSVSLDWLVSGSGQMRLDHSHPLCATHTTAISPTAPRKAGQSSSCEPTYTLPDSQCTTGRQTDAEYGVGRVYSAGDVVILPCVQPRLSPSGGTLEPESKNPGIAFQHFWLAQMGRIDSMAVLTMRGNHMEPTIRSGSQLLLDRSQCEPVPGEVFALAIDGDVVVKRIDRLPGKLLLMNDNSVFPMLELPHPSDTIFIVGRILWAGSPLC